MKIGTGTGAPRALALAPSACAERRAILWGIVEVHPSTHLFVPMRAILDHSQQVWCPTKDTVLTVVMSLAAL